MLSETHEGRALLRSLLLQARDIHARLVHECERCPLTAPQAFQALQKARASSLELVNALESELHGGPSLVLEAFDMLAHPKAEELRRFARAWRLEVGHA